MIAMCVWEREGYYSKNNLSSTPSLSLFITFLIYAQWLREQVTPLKWCSSKTVMNCSHQPTHAFLISQTCFDFSFKVAECIWNFRAKGQCVVCQNVTSRLLETGWAGFLQSDDKSRLFVRHTMQVPHNLFRKKKKSLTTTPQFRNLWGQNVTMKEHCCTLIKAINNWEIMNWESENKLLKHSFTYLVLH